VIAVFDVFQSATYEK
jgi:putative addiction module killer protein/probable addiction module antidote protein